MHYSRTTRLVERYVGALVCFAFSLFSVFRRAPKDASIKRILLIELVEMGAAVMAYSSLLYIKKKLPDAELFVLCLASKKESWLLLDIIPKKNVYVLDDRSVLTLLPSIVRQVRSLSRRKIDLIIDLELFLRISAIIAFLIRAKFRAGFYRYTMEGMYRGTFYDVKCAFNQNMHIAKNMLALTKSAVPPSARYHNFDGPISAEEIVVPGRPRDEVAADAVRRKADSAGIKTPYILVAPTVGKALSVRDNPKESYVQVVRALLALYPNHSVVLVGTREHEAVCGYIKDRVSDARCTNFAGSTDSLLELMELFRAGDLLISNDSGNPHFAAMVGLKSLAIFGPETPFMYGPLGKCVCLYDFFHTSPSITAYNHKNPPEEGSACLTSIAPERVVETARLMMDDSARYGTVNNTFPYLL